VGAQSLHGTASTNQWFTASHCYQVGLCSKQQKHIPAKISHQVCCVDKGGEVATCEPWCLHRQLMRWMRQSWPRWRIQLHRLLFAAATLPTSGSFTLHLGKIGRVAFHPGQQMLNRLLQATKPHRLHKECGGVKITVTLSRKHLIVCPAGALVPTGASHALTCIHT
jgi:hypothetical protein